MTIIVVYFLAEVSSHIYGLFCVPLIARFRMGATSSSIKASLETMVVEERANKYFGDTINGVRSGKGKLYDKNGDLVYEGEFLNDKRWGKGISYATKANDDSYYYEGDFENDKKHGVGVDLYGNGEVHYEGEFKNNKYNGQGILFRNRDIKGLNYDRPLYSGHFKKGMRDGYGVEYDESNQAVYKGNWVRNKRSGHGWELSNGIQVYMGNFRINKRNGKGEEFYSDGLCKKYKGGFRLGKYEGHGTLFYKDQDGNNEQYVGEWKNGLAHGKGKYYVDKKLEYDGDWIKDKRHGQGTVYKDDEVLYTGKWFKDKPVETVKKIKREKEEGSDAESPNSDKKRTRTK